MEMKQLILLCFLCYSLGEARILVATGSTSSFDVRNYGAKANGQSDDSQAFAAAFAAACNSTGSVTLLIPSGTYLAGPLKFSGPCRNVSDLTIQLQGTVKASTDLNLYQKDSWVEFSYVNNLTVTGGGTFDGQGAASWPFNKCPQKKDCKVLPTSLMFVNLNNTVVKDITSVNPKFFHIGVVSCQNFQGSGLTITAPGESPNTDGIHLERNTGVTITESNIGTGDDCVSVGQGNTQVTLAGIKCGPGHGISVGSLGRYSDEGDVRGLIVQDCSITGTMNGIRIKTWENSPSSSEASNMTFENIVMSNVGNPIIIDQTYCPYANCDSQSPSKVKISDITFRNITGTSTTAVAVTLKCSKDLPCQNVKLQDVNLTATGLINAAVATAACLNVAAEYTGTQNPPPCQ